MQQGRSEVEGSPLGERVGVVGGGIMGAGIAEICARSGSDVIVKEVGAEAAERCESRIASSLDQAVRRGKVTAGQRNEALSRITLTQDMEALWDRTLVIEAVPEFEQLKAEVFRDIDAVLEDGSAIIASNTSSIPIMKLASTTRRPDRVLGTHFFNPVPVLPLVELVPALTTRDDVVAGVRSFLEDELDRVVISSADRAGFVVNSLLIPYILSAIRMYESGVASKEDIDAGMVHGANHPMGPLALADLIGLDTLQSVAESMYSEFRDSSMVPPALLSRMVEAGLLGRKANRGFYLYEGSG